MITYTYLFKIAWKFLQGSKVAFIAIFITNIIGMAASLGKPYFNGQFFNAIQLGGDKMWQNMFYFLGIMAFLHLANVWLWYTSNYLAEKTALTIRKNAILKYYETLYKLPINFHIKHHSGDTLSRIRQSSEEISKFPSRQPQITKYLMKFIGPLVLLTIFSWKVSLLTLGMSLIVVGGMTICDNKKMAFMKATNHTVHDFNSVMQDSVTNIKTIKVLKKFSQIIANISNKFLPIRNKDLKIEKINKEKWSFFDIGTFVLTNSVIIFYVYITLKADDILLIGNIFAVQQYVKEVQQFFLGYGAEYQNLLQMKVNYEEILPILNENAEQQPTKQVKHLNNIEIKNFSFTYDGKRTPQLNNISLNIQQGQKIALIGESGSGKSTLLSLLSGLMNSPETVIINGKQANLNTLSSITTLILQDPEIFEDSILFNLTFGEKYSDKKIAEALKISRFDEVLSRTKSTLADKVNEKGLNLSGGEKQRLALSRGILAMGNTELLLLDEPTSSVDVYNENAIYDALFSKFKGKTIISSLHRLNIAPKFDYIYLFKNGKIIEHGTPTALMAQKGIFADMMQKYLKTLTDHERNK